MGELAAYLEGQKRDIAFENCRWLILVHRELQKIKAGRSYSNGRALENRQSSETLEGNEKGNRQKIIKRIDCSTKCPKEIRTHKFACFSSWKSLFSDRARFKEVWRFLFCFFKEYSLEYYQIIERQDVCL